MIHIEQYGSNTFFIRDLPTERPLERYELVELLRNALEQGISPREFLDSDTLGRLMDEEQASLF